MRRGIPAVTLALVLTGCSDCLPPVLVTLVDDAGEPRAVDEVTWERSGEGEHDCDPHLRDGVLGALWHCGARFATDRSGEWRIRAYVPLTQDVYSEVAVLADDSCFEQAELDLTIP